MEEQTKVICLDEVDSTNQYLKEHAENLPDGCVVTALHQTAGKGRLGKQWHDREGKSLLASWLYKNLTVEQMTLLPFLSGISVRQALEKMWFTSIFLKWPNDVVAFKDGEFFKIAGILCESRIMACLLYTSDAADDRIV